MSRLPPLPPSCPTCTPLGDTATPNTSSPARAHRDLTSDAFSLRFCHVAAARCLQDIRQALVGGRAQVCFSACCMQSLGSVPATRLLAHEDARTRCAEREQAEAQAHCAREMAARATHFTQCTCTQASVKQLCAHGHFTGCNPRATGLGHSYILQCVTTLPHVQKCGIAEVLRQSPMSSCFSIMSAEACVGEAIHNTKSTLPGVHHNLFTLIPSMHWRHDLQSNTLTTLVV